MKNTKKIVGILLAITISLSQFMSVITARAEELQTTQTPSATAQETSSPSVPTTDITPPTIPTNVNSMDITETKITLSWTSSTDDIGVIKYDVFRDGAEIYSTLDTTCVFRPHPDTRSGNIRTAFRNYPDSIPAHPDTLSS